MKTGSLTGSACKWGPKNSFWSPWGPTWEQWLSPHPTPTTLPHPLFIVSLWTPVILAEPVGWVDFQEKKGRGRTGQEATLKQPRKLIFQTWNQIFGQVTRQWAWPTGTTQKESTSSAIYCKITISFGEILIFTSTVLGGLFLQIFKPGFLTFSQWDYHPALPG